MAGQTTTLARELEKFTLLDSFLKRPKAPRRVDPGHPEGMFFSDFFDPLWLFKIFKRLALNPRKGRRMVSCQFLVSLCFLKSLRMLFAKAHPLNPLLKEAERASAP